MKNFNPLEVDKLNSEKEFEITLYYYMRFKNKLSANENIYLSNLISEYEDYVWKGCKVTDKLIKESDEAEKYIESFIKNNKKEIDSNFIKWLEKARMKTNKK